MGQIQNTKELATSKMRRDALAIAEAGYRAIRTEEVVKSKMKVSNGELRIGEKTFKIAGRKVFYVGVGKCAISAGRAIEKVLGKALTAGIALDVADTNSKKSSKIETIIGTHPLPSETNVKGSKRILEFLADKNETDLVIFVISGGGSTLLCLPDLPSTKSDLVLGEAELFEKLTEKGAPIQELNTVRKHLSRARGGGLATAAYPAKVVSLIFSDVPGNDLHTISSGPTILDSSTIADAQAVLAKYDIAPEARVKFIETPKEPKLFERVHNMLFLSNLDSLSAMRDEATKRGYATEIVNDHFTGEAREVGKSVTEKLHDAPSKTALLYAGESTVTLEGNGGVGGRSQEMALSVLNDVKEDELILPFASDGRDNTDHAGAIADADTLTHAHERKLSIDEYLNTHTSYDFFRATKDALVTGYTGSNVSDLIVALKK